MRQEEKDFSDVYTVRLTGDDKRVLRYALQKWPDLSDPIKGVNVAALLREIVRDWEAWDNVWRGKSALQIYEATLTRKYMEAMAQKLGIDVSAIASEFSFDQWAEGYHGKKKGYDLLSKDAETQQKKQ